MSRVRSLTATLLVSLMTACGGSPGGGGRAPDEVPAPHLVVSASSLTFSASAGGRNPSPQPFMVRNAGAGAMARPVATTSAPWLTPFVSGGGPDYKVLVEVDTRGLAPGDHQASVALSTNADNSPGSVAVVLHLAPAQAGPVARVEIQSGGFLMTTPGETTRVWATAFGADGRVLDLLPTFRSLAPGVISITPDGIVTAVAPVGSTQVVAEAGGVTSSPAVGIVATPAPDARVIDDEDLLTWPGPVDPGAPFGPGWRYQVRLHGNAMFLPGAIVLTRGSQHVAGRVVEVVFDPESTDLVLEVVPLSEVFAELQLSETFPLRDPVEAAAPSFTCSSGKPGSGGTATLRQFSLPPPELALRASVSIGSAELELTGSLRGDVTVDVALPAGFEDTITCEAPAGELTAAWPGALALLLPSRIPYGAGFALSARAGEQLTLTSAFQLDATGAWGMRAGGGPSRLQGTFDLQPEVSLLPSTPGSAYHAEVQPYLFARLSAGSPFLPGGDFDLVELRAGLSGGIDWKPPPLQAADPAYAARWNVVAFAGVSPGSDPASTLGRLGLLGGAGPLEVPAGLELPLWRSPAGTLVADPPRVTPDGLVTLTVALPGLVAPPGRTPVGKVEIYRRMGEPPGSLALLCSVEPLVPDQQVFSCTTGLPGAAPGDLIDLYAFAVDPTGALPTEVAPDGVASVTVE